MEPVIDDPLVDTKGDDWLWILTFEEADGQPLSLAGITFEDVMILWNGGGRIDIDEGEYLSVNNSAAGEVRILVPREVTVTVPPKKEPRLVFTIIDAASIKSTLVIIPLEIVVP
jgi:hypothetical protein